MVGIWLGLGIAVSGIWIGAGIACIGKQGETPGWIAVAATGATIAVALCVAGVVTK